MSGFVTLLRVVVVSGIAALTVSCSSGDDGYPKISEIKTPTPNFLSDGQQRARMSQMEREKAAHVYRKESEIRARSRWIKKPVKKTTE